MITIYEALCNYHHPADIKLTKNHLADLGNIVGKHFKTTWCKEIAVDGRQIPDTGFKKEEQLFGVFVVNAYPDAYEPIMKSIFDTYFSGKAGAGKRKRKRLPAASSRNYR